MAQFKKIGNARRRFTFETLLPRPSPGNGSLKKYFDKWPFSVNPFTPLRVAIIVIVAVAAAVFLSLFKIILTTW